MSICTAARTATRTRKATPKDHKLDLMYDRFVGLCTAAGHAEARMIEGQGIADRDERWRLCDAKIEAESAKTNLQYDIIRAVLDEAGVRSITVAQYNQAATPYAVVRTARRVYAVIPDNCGEFHPDPATTGFVAVLDL